MPAKKTAEQIDLDRWEVGRPSPTDAYRALTRDGELTGPAVATHPGGGALQICVAGTTVTEGVLRHIAAAADPGAED